MKAVSLAAGAWVVLYLAGSLAAAENPVVEQLREQWEIAHKQIIQAAEAMPIDQFQYQPSPKMRRFGEIIAHLAGENMTWMELVAGVHPGSVTRFDHLRSRQQILQALREHYDYGAKVLAALSDKTAMGTISFGPKRSPRWLIAVQAITHVNEHYGNLVVYLRLNAIVPPSTERFPKLP